MTRGSSRAAARSCSPAPTSSSTTTSSARASSSSPEPEALLVDVGKQAGDARSTSQASLNELLVACAGSFEVVVRLKGGDPFVFGRGAEELHALAAAGLDVEVVPGVTSAFAVPASVGIAVTTRGVASAVTVATGHDVARGAVDWSRMADPTSTLVVLMAVAQLTAIRDALLAAGRHPATPCAVIERGTTDDETLHEVRLDHLGTVTARTPAVLVVGQAVAARVREMARGRRDGSGRPSLTTLHHEVAAGFASLR